MNVYEIVTEKILEQLKNGVIPWQKPWKGRTGLAVSHTSGKPYSFLNQLLLGMEGGEWLTFGQIQKEGGRIKKGAKSQLVVFYKVYEKEPLAPEEQGVRKGIEKRFALRWYKVFNVVDCENIEAKHLDPVVEADQTLQPLEKADKVIEDYKNRSGITLTITQSGSAYYAPLEDEVVCPELSQYTEVSEYYSTIFHELTHSTGHVSRLNRKLNNNLSAKKDEYSKEELVAEMGAAFCLNALGISTEKAFQNSVSYIGNWMRELKKESRLIIVASAAAEKAVNLIMNTQHEEAATEQPAL